MSFRCQVCTKTFPNKDNQAFRPEKVVTKTREKIYYPSESRGWEIVQEKSCCPSCVATLNHAQREFGQAGAARVLNI